MTPIDFKEVNVRLAEKQDEYQTLPAFMNNEQTISCWRLTWKERFQVLFSGRLWLSQLNYTQPLQPQLPLTVCPFVRDNGKA